MTNDSVINFLTGSYDVNDLALWGEGVTDEGVKSIIPKIIRDDDNGWEESEGFLRGFRNLRRLEVCDTCGVSLGVLSKVLGSVYFKDTLEVVSFRNCAGMHQDDSEVDDEVHGRFVDRLVEGTWEGRLREIDLRETWLHEGCVERLRKEVKVGTKVMVD